MAMLSADVTGNFHECAWGEVVVLGCRLSYSKQPRLSSEIIGLHLRGELQKHGKLVIRTSSQKRWLK
jgi:hypothetical protein